MFEQQKRPQLVLNALELRADWDASLGIARVPYESREGLEQLRRDLGTSYVARRAGSEIEIASVEEKNLANGTPDTKALGQISKLVAFRLADWLVEHFSGLGRKILRRGRTLTVISERAEDDLLRGVLPTNAAAKPGVGFHAGFELDVRVEYPQGKPQVLLAIGCRSIPLLETAISDLLAGGVSVEGMYVRRAAPSTDPRLSDMGRLTGRVDKVLGGSLALTDCDEGWSEIPATDSRLEPRIEILAAVLAQLEPKAGNAQKVLARLRDAAGKIASGREQFRRIRSLAEYLGKQVPRLLGGHEGTFGPLISSRASFPRNEIVAKPALIRR